MSNRDLAFLHRAIELAHQAEAEGNLPVGAVITVDGQIVAEGRNTIWSPVSAGTRHAEMEALRAVPPELWGRAREMTLYTTLEPCLMCAGAILLHHLGRLVFGASDDWGGARSDPQKWPPYFQMRYADIRWEGPVLPTECDELSRRVRALVAQRYAESAQEETP